MLITIKKQLSTGGSWRSPIYSVVYMTKSQESILSQASVRSRFSSDLRSSADRVQVEGAGIGTGVRLAAKSGQVEVLLQCKLSLSDVMQNIE